MAVRSIIFNNDIGERLTMKASTGLGVSIFEIIPKDLFLIAAVALANPVKLFSFIQFTDGDYQQPIESFTDQFIAHGDYLSV